MQTVRKLLMIRILVFSIRLDIVATITMMKKLYLYTAVTDCVVDIAQTYLLFSPQAQQRRQQEFYGQIAVA